MARDFDPRGDLPPSTIQSTYYTPLLKHGRRQDSLRHGVRSALHGRGDSVSSLTLLRPSNLQRTTRIDLPASTPLLPTACHDWIFSSASNVHVAIDRSAFKTYTPFESYVLRVADQTPVKVRGIGTVALKIRRQPGSNQTHTIILENVLHVPKWICNLFSDIYFEPATAFEHTWTDFGVSFLRKENGQLTYWGFTESFLGLERLVLVKRIRGRSPMLEDQDREVFSVNLTWPQGQRDKWEAQLAADDKKRQQRQEAKLKRETRSGLTEMTKVAIPTKTLLDLPREYRSQLTDLSANIMHQRGPSDTASSLRAPTTRSRGSSFK